MSPSASPWKIFWRMEVTLEVIELKYEEYIVALLVELFDDVKEGCIVIVIGL